MPKPKAKQNLKRVPKNQQIKKSNAKDYTVFKITRKSKTEAIYKSAPKLPKPKYKPILAIFKDWFYRLNFRLVLIAILLLGGLILGIFLVNLYNQNKQDQAFYDTILKETGLGLAEINAKKQMIGTKDQLIKEITNYQSAPEDLKNYVLKDYYVFKSSCIVNGQFIGPTSYEIANVTYDSYAKILKDCNGQDQQILAKVGGQWAVVASGQTAPDCNDVNSLSIPMGIAPTCTDGKVLYPNPNP